MAFQFKPYTEETNTQASTNTGGGSFKFKPYTETPTLSQALDKQFPHRTAIRNYVPSKKPQTAIEQQSIIERDKERGVSISADTSPTGPSLPSGLSSGLGGDIDPRTGRTTGGVVGFAYESLRAKSSPERQFDYFYNALLENDLTEEQAANYAAKYVTGEGREDIPEEIQDALWWDAAYLNTFAGLESLDFAGPMAALPIPIAGTLSRGGKGLGRIFRRIIPPEDLSRIAASDDVTEIADIARNRGANQIADNTEFLESLRRARTVDEVGQALDQAEDVITSTRQVGRAQPPTSPAPGITPAQTGQTPSPQVAPRATPPARPQQPVRPVDIARTTDQVPTPQQVPIPQQIPSSSLSQNTLDATQQWMSGGNRRAMTPEVVSELRAANIKPNNPITLYRIGDVDDSKFQSWSKTKPTRGEEFTERTFSPDDILVDTTDPRFVDQFSGGQKEAIEQFNRVESEVIVWPKNKPNNFTPSRTPSPGASPQTPRFAQGADTMFEGADIAGRATPQMPRSTAALSEQAQNLVRTLDESELEEVMQRNDDLGTAVTAEYLNQLAREYAAAPTQAEKTKKAKQAAKVALEKADRLYEAGREIQAASLLSRLTPEGQLRGIASDIKKYNQGKPKKKQIPQLTEKQVGEILEEMDEIRRTVDPTERQMKFHNLQRKVRGYIPSTNLEKISNLWKAGLLTGIKTLGLNVFSNVSHLSSELLKDVPATAVDWVASLVTKERKIALTTRGITDGLREGKSKGIRYFHTGFDERNIGAKLDYKRVNYGNGPVGKKLQWYTDKVFQTIGATDQPMYFAALRKSYMSQALAQARNEGLKGKARVKRAYEIVENPTEEMMEYAVRDARIAIFTNDTTLGEMAQSLQNMKYVGQFLVPFRQTPSAVATQIFNYTPAGAVAEVVKQIRKGKFDQKSFSEAMGRSITGTAPLYIGWELANAGLVQLDYPQGDSRQIELDKAEGVEYNSIKIGDEWRNPIVLGPVGNLLLLGAHINVAMEKSGSTWEGVRNGTLGTWDSFKEQTFLTGLSTFVSVVDDLSGRGESAFQGFIASFIPTIVSDVARATDTVDREVSGSVGERIKSRIPGARQTLEPKVDVLGREQMIGGRGGEILPDFLESMIDPTRPSQDVSTPVTHELNRLMNEELRVAPTRSGLYGYDVLTDSQETQLQKYAGQMINQNLNMLFQSEQYRQAIDEDKADAIDDIVKRSKDTARARMVLEILAQVPESQRAKAIQRMDEDGLITRDVARILNESN